MKHALDEYNDEDLEELIQHAEAKKRARREICEHIGRQRQRNSRLERERRDLLESNVDVSEMVRELVRELAEQRGVYDAKDQELTQARRCAGDAEAQASLFQRKAQELQEQLRTLRGATTNLEPVRARLHRRRRLRELFASAPPDLEGFKAAYLESCRGALEHAEQAVRRASEALRRR